MRLKVLISTGVLLALGLSVQAQDKVTYDDHIKPIFRENCEKCHNPDKAKGGLDLSTFSAMMAGGSSGAAVVPGSADESWLYLLVTHQDEPYMPPKSPKRPDPELELIKNWINGGLLQNASSVAVKSSKPKFEFKLSEASAGKPEGPPPMPKDLLLEPVVTTPKPNSVTASDSSPWAPLAAVAGQKQVILYNTDNSQIEGILPFPEGFPTTLKFSRNGKLLLAAGGVGAKRGRVVVWSVETGDRVIELGEDYDAIQAADISADHGFIATGGPDKYVNIYDTTDNSRMHHIKKHTEWVTAMEFSPDGVLLATGDRNGNVHVWETFTGQEFFKLAGHKGMVTDISWRMDSDVVATASEDGSIKLWNMHNGGQIKSWNAHGGVLSLEYAHNGRLVSCGRDNSTVVWDGNGGKLKTYEKTADLACSAIFSHDGNKVITGDWTGKVLMWNTEDTKRSGELSANPPNLPERIAWTENRIKELNDPYQKALAESKAAADALTALTAEMDQMRPGKDAAEKQAQATEVALAEAKKGLESLGSTVGEAQKMIDQKKKELADATAGEKASTDKVTATQNAHKAAADIVAKQPANAELPKKVAETKTKLDQVTALVAEAEKKVKASEAGHKMAEAVAGAAPENADLQTKKAEAKKALDAAAAELTKAKEQVGPAQNAHKAANDAVAADQKRVQDLQNKVAEAKKNLDAANGELAKAKEMVGHAKQQLAGAEKTMSDRQTAIDLAKNNLTEAETKNKQAQEAKTKSTAAWQAKEKQVADAKTNADGKKAAADAVKPDLAPLHHNLVRWKAAQFNIQVVSARRAWNAKQSEKDAIAASLKAAEQAANAKKSAYDQLKAEYEKMKPKT